MPLVESLWILLGLVALMAGAEGVVRGGRGFARRVGTSELAVGLVVASIGTSLPELFTAANAARSASGGDASAAAVGMGNLLGSNLFLLLFLLGLVAIVQTLPVDRRIWRRDGVAVGASSLALLVFSLDGRIGPWEGAALILAFVFWLAVVAVQEREDEPDSDAEEAGPKVELDPVWVDGVRVVIGLVLLVEGSDLVVGQGVVLAEKLRIGATLVGVLAGIGTSLPEIGVSLRAGRSSSQLSLGNLLGSALTNALLCTGVAAVAGDLLVSREALTLELPFLVAGTVVSLALLWERRELSRAEGIALATLFALYLTLRVLSGL